MGNAGGGTAIAWLDPDGREHVWPSLDAWVADWWASHRVTSGATTVWLDGQEDVEGPDTPAKDYLDELVTEGNPACLALIEALAEAAETEQDLADLGAGDIETLLCHLDDGERFIDDVERRARQSPRLPAC